MVPEPLGGKYTFNIFKNLSYENNFKENCRSKSANGSS